MRLISRAPDIEQDAGLFQRRPGAFGSEGPVSMDGNGTESGKQDEDGEGDIHGFDKKATDTQFVQEGKNRLTDKVSAEVVEFV
jgi:hypothetical protein